MNDAKTKGRITKSVANLSLGSVYSKAFNEAVAAAAKAGLFMGVAAGNSGANAANYSPASEATACTVGASDQGDLVASFSNYGPLVDVFAPGSDILSTWIGSTTASNTLSGTSMATPHIVGLAAYLISVEGSRTPTALCERIKTLGQKGKLSMSTNASAAGTQNVLAYNGNGA